MTRFIYVADTHIGGGKDGYRQQERYPEYLDELFAGLHAWIEEHQVDFLLHGGDITNEGTREQIEAAVSRFSSLGLPFYACLGNHDLFYKDSYRHWLTSGARFLLGDSLNFKLETPDMLFYSFCLHWDSRIPPYYWNIDLAQTPLPDPKAMKEFEALLQTADRPVAVLIHAPLNAIPAHQTGLAEDIHIPHNDLREYFLDKAARYPHFKLVLAAHSHVNTLDTGSGLLTLTSASFTEAPFDFRLVEVDGERISINTISLNDSLGLDVDYDLSKAWVQGMAEERQRCLC